MKSNRNHWVIVVKYDDGTSASCFYPTKEAAHLAAAGFRMAHGVIGVGPVRYETY